MVSLFVGLPEEQTRWEGDNNQQRRETIWNFVKEKQDGTKLRTSSIIDHQAREPFCLDASQKLVYEGSLPGSTATPSKTSHYKHPGSLPQCPRLGVSVRLNAWRLRFAVVDNQPLAGQVVTEESRPYLSYVFSLGCQIPLYCVDYQSVKCATYYCFASQNVFV